MRRVLARRRAGAEGQRAREFPAQSRARGRARSVDLCPRQDRHAVRRRSGLRSSTTSRRASHRSHRFRPCSRSLRRLGARNRIRTAGCRTPVVPRAVPRARSARGILDKPGRRLAHRELSREQPRRAMYAYDLDIGELETRIGLSANSSDTASASSTSFHVTDRSRRRVDQESGRARSRQFAKAFVAALPVQIDSVDADDVKTYLPASSRTSSRNGPSSRRQARRDARAPREEVISITNENRRGRGGDPPSASAPRTRRSRSRSTRSSTTSASTRSARSHDRDAVRQRARGRPADARRADPRDRAQVEDRRRHSRSAKERVPPRAQSRRGG